jgi:hypothetical protein
MSSSEIVQEITHTRGMRPIALHRPMLPDIKLKVTKINEPSVHVHASDVES